LCYSTDGENYKLSLLHIKIKQKLLKNGKRKYIRGKRTNVNISNQRFFSHLAHGHTMSIRCFRDKKNIPKTTSNFSEIFLANLVPKYKAECIFL
jgi:hypothetical protein